MARSTVHYADNETNNILKRLHNKLRPAGTPVQRVEFMIELLLLRIFEVKLKQDKEFTPLRKLFDGENYRLLFSHLQSLTGELALPALNNELFPFYASILSKARAVFPNNLPQKVQDQLVLIEEVFSNSSFTANVKSGNLSEIIGLVHEIDEERLLKTDLLGDAIESSLSETGGTRDIGLYRTPDHIRQMMVALVDPDFTDAIFDPTCGTGGFLFDAYQYVLEKVTQNGKWVGEKAHPELQDYFKIHFKKFNAKMPSSAIANSFYRSGIGGIEYLGMIRKMAAINLYVRGLNPQNIEQGDSLRMYDPATDENSKSVIIANPPFGAERDQPAYPNVWEEFPRESETTILFVKLMFNLLKKGGRCAVVVSEGLLTWNQNSARALRKMLLDEASLRAVISLPQGVFVSKGGQGAKTSILYFEKGEPTEWVWYYKIENDGFTMGVNRKPVEGSQIPELIELFTKFVKRGQIPPETKHSLVIPAQWLKTLDPRIKERIRSETKEELTQKHSAKREKILAQLKEKKAKGKLTSAEHHEKLKEFEQVVENAVQNETAKRIDRAFAYSFNLQNYRSSLSKEQMKEWQETVNGVVASAREAFSSLDKRYKDFQSAEPKTALKILASFDPRSALEMDIAREYVSAATSKDKKLEKLNEILKRGFQYPKVELGKPVTLVKNWLEIEDEKEYKLLTCKLHGQGIFLREFTFGRDIKTKKQQVVRVNQLLVAEIDAKNGGYGVVPRDGDGAIVSSHYFVYDIDEKRLLPAYLSVMLMGRNIEEQVRNYVKGATSYAAIRAHDFTNIKIPLPSLEIQREIVEKIQKQKAIIDGAEKILDGHEVDYNIFERFEKRYIDYFATLNPPKNTAHLSDDDLVSFVPMEAINDAAGKINTKIERKLEEVKSGYTFFSEDDVLFAKITPCMENGKVAVAEGLTNKVGFGTTELHVFRAKKDKVLPKYVYYLLRTRYFRQLAKESMTGASGHKRVPESFLREFAYPLPDIETQTQIVERLDKEMQALENVRQLKEHAQKRIEEILKDVWGEG